MEDFEHRDLIWEVLGEAPCREASPWFADRVMRAVGESRPVGRAAWLRWAIPMGVGCAVTVMAISASLSDSAPQARFAVTPAAVEFEAIQDLDLMVANSEASLWLDTAFLSSN